MRMEIVAWHLYSISRKWVTVNNSFIWITNYCLIFLKELLETLSRVISSQGFQLQSYPLFNIFIFTMTHPRITECFPKRNVIFMEIIFFTVLLSFCGKEFLTSQLDPKLSTNILNNVPCMKKI